MLRHPLRTAITALLLLAIALPAFALGERPSADAVRDHGLFLRLSGGFGFAGTAAEVPFGSLVDDLSFTGFSGDFNFALGGFVAPGLALHGSIMSWTVTEPDADWGIFTATIPSDLNMTAVGAGLTWYILPSGLYLSGSVGAGKLNIDDADSDNGLALDVTFGKEWWVSRQWSLGIAAGLGVHAISEPGLQDDWQGSSLSLRFSASRR